MTSHHSNNWDDFIALVSRAISDYKSHWTSPSAITFFRGHSDTSFILEPGLFREYKGHYYTKEDEANLYYEFRLRAGGLLDPNIGPWEQIFAMQHQGVPTRLLDWTENFAVALYFALEGAVGDIDIWMIDPYELNAKTCKNDEVLDVEVDLESDYWEYFVEHTKKIEWEDVVAVYPRRHNPRIIGQTGLFTLHSTRERLDTLSLDRLHRFTLDKRCLADAQNFLELSGVNDFSIFPDLPGLTKFLKRRFPPQNVDIFKV